MRLACSSIMASLYADSLSEKVSNYVSAIIAKQWHIGSDCDSYLGDVGPRFAFSIFTVLSLECYVPKVKQSAKGEWYYIPSGVFDFWRYLVRIRYYKKVKYFSHPDSDSISYSDCSHEVSVILQWSSA